MTWSGVLDIYSAVHTGTLATLDVAEQWVVADGTQRAWTWSSASLDSATFMHCRQWSIEVLRSGPDHATDNLDQPIIVPSAISEDGPLDRRQAVIDAARRAGVPAGVIGRHIAGAACIVIDVNRSPSDDNASFQNRLNSTAFGMATLSPGLPVIVVVDPRLSDGSGWMTHEQVAHAVSVAATNSAVAGLCWRAVGINGAWINVGDVEANIPAARARPFDIVRRFGSGPERQPIYVRVGSLRGHLPKINSGLNPMSPIMVPVGERAGRWTRDIVEPVHNASLKGGTGIEVIKMPWAGFNPTIVQALLDGTTHLYRLNEASGNAADEIGSSPLTLTGTIGSVTGVDGVDGARSSATATAGRLQSATALVDYSHPWSIALWIYPTSLPSDTSIMGQYNTFAGGQWGLVTSGADLTFFANSTTGLSIATIPDLLEVNQWFLVVVSWNAAGKWTLRAHKASAAPTVAGGAQNATGVLPGSPSTPATAIFNNSGSLVDGFVGAIDELIVFDNELAAYGPNENAVLEQIWGGGVGIDFAALDSPFVPTPSVGAPVGVGVTRVRIGL